MAGGYSQGASKETRNCCHTENQKRKSSHAARGYKRVQSGATPVMEDTGKHVKVQIPKAKALLEASIQGLNILMTLGIDWGSLVSTRAAKVPWLVFSMNSVGNQD